MVLWWKSRKAMRERPFCPEGEGLRLYILRSNRQREREGRGGEVIRIRNWLSGSKFKFRRREWEGILK
jgi:hypothetical protein